ncbi:MAG: hypothetical protein K1X53_16005 [Candidatus Sumerlaeaceae bacterium]|nr:hypothetical protein [Candidatus Sumerlaeaceae bacterium]
MNSKSPIPIPETAPMMDSDSPIQRAGAMLDFALTGFHGPVPHKEGSRPLTRAFAALFRAALPKASDEVLGALVELCIIESARARAQARQGNGARVLDILPSE